MTLQLSGIHHLTAITANVRANFQFYSHTLGLRLVKKTVNQDDTSAYHLFYADGLATPGTDLTFFDWPVQPERRGTQSVTCTGLRVGSAASVKWWKARFEQNGIHCGEVSMVDDRASLSFEDPEGQRFRLVDDGGIEPSHPWSESLVPSEHQIKGLGPITISVPKLDDTSIVLTQIMNMKKLRKYPSPDSVGEVHVFSMGEGGPAAELHLALQPGLNSARQGAGAVHHVAFRTPDVDQLKLWAQRLRSMRVPSSGEVERYYFRSLYFREPSGVLSRSQPMAQVLPSMSLWNLLVRRCLCHPSWRSKDTTLRYA